MQASTSIQAISEVRARITRERQQEGRHYYLLGLHCLEVERRRGFSDKQLLKRCCGLFVESIRRDRQAPGPYLKLAYLLITMQAWDQARPYLEQALSLDPQHPEARALERRLMAGAAPVAGPVKPSLPEPGGLQLLDI